MWRGKLIRFPGLIIGFEFEFYFSQPIEFHLPDAVIRPRID